MSSYDTLNQHLNDEMQRLAVLINSGEHSERDRNALAKILYPKLKYFVRKYVTDEHEIEEIVNETLYKVFKGLASFNSAYRFTTWLYCIARNEALLWIHNSKKNKAVGIDTLLTPIEGRDDIDEVIEKELFMSDLYTYMVQEISVLPESLEKSMLVDKLFNLMKGEDLAEKYNMNINTVKTKIRKAKRDVTDHILEKNPEFEPLLKTYYGRGVKKVKRAKANETP